MFIQIIVALPFYVLTFLILRYQKAHHLTLNNLWLHNIYTFVETGILLIGLNSKISGRVVKVLLRIGFLLFLMVFAYEYITKDSYKIYNLSFFIESMLITIFSSLILYQSLHKATSDWKTNPDIWILLGLILYFAGDVPYVGLLNYLNSEFPGLSKLFVHLVNNLLANLRYLLLALGFWLLISRLGKNQSETT
ncbi:MAG TPA: hypothetical protein PLQ93_10170 [Bacteroidia bacterium]|nr:hypothetical protein [Bacteroidia bacterium]